MSIGTAKEIQMCGTTLRIGDKVKVEYTTGTWSKGGTIEGVITELWSPEFDNHLQARVDGAWCFHDHDKVIAHNPGVDARQAQQPTKEAR